MNYPNLHVLVLAAGASTRLGQPKQLVKLGGVYALNRVVSCAVSIGGSSVTVIVGAHAKELTPLLTHSPASVIVNRHWEEGIASSIRVGVAAVPSSATGLLIVLGDQVAVTGEDLRRLASAWNGQESVIATAVYRQHAGVPAIFPRWAFSELEQLRGDRGARDVIQRNAFRLAHVPMPNAAVDLDTPEDLAELVGRYEGGKVT